MTRARRCLPLALLCLLVSSIFACSQSSLSGASLELDSVSPGTVSARGGETLTLRGRGFSDGVQVFVRDQALTANVVDGSTLQATMPPSYAGKADVTVKLQDSTATLKSALTITPLPLDFAEAPAWTLPKLPGPVDVLGSSAAGPLAGGAWGLDLLTCAKGTVSALPVTALVSGSADAATMPAVLALASAPSGLRVAVCVDATPALEFLEAKAGSLVGNGSADPGGACVKLAMGSVQPDNPWVYALVQTDSGLALKAWMPGSTYKAVTVETPAFPPTVDAFAAADLNGDGGDDLIVAGTDGTTPSLAAWMRSTAKDGSLVFTDEGTIPPRATRTYALVPADFEGDGNTDVFAAGEGADSFYVNDGHGHFADESWSRLPFSRATAAAAATADFDRDGRLDLVVATPDAADRLYLGTDSGFEDQTPALGLTPDLGGDAVVLDDLDHDGDTDVITATAADHALRIRWMVAPGG